RRGAGRLQKGFGWKWTWREDIPEYPVRERKRKWCDQGECVGQRQYIENAKATSDSRLAIRERAPRKSNPRFEVTKRRVQKVRRAQVWLAVCQMKKIRETAVSLSRDRGQLIAEACADRQICTEPDIVL